MDRPADAPPGPTTARRRLLGPGGHCTPAVAHVGPGPGPGDRRRRGQQVRARPAAPAGARAREAADQAGEGSPRSRGPGTQDGCPADGWGGGHSGRQRGDRRGSGGARGMLPARHPAHRASVLNDDLLGQHDTAVRGPFLLLPLGHFTILESWRCCSHSRGGRPQRRVPSRHYCRAEPLGMPAAIFRARPASGGASHRAIGDERPGHAPRLRPAPHVTPSGPAQTPRPRPSAAELMPAAGGWVLCALRSPDRWGPRSALGGRER